MTNCLNLDYSDILQLSDKSVTDSNDFSAWMTRKDWWGSYSERSLQSTWFKINELKPSFNTNCRVSVRYEALPNVINFCLPLCGYIGTHFNHKNVTAELTHGKYHNIYSPDVDYQLLIKKEVHVIHIEVDLNHFISLLCDAEAWSATIKKQISRRDFYYTGEATSSEIKKIIVDILNTPLHGSIKKMFVEAKMMELLTLQFANLVQGTCAKDSIRKSDQELAEAVKQYLSETFTAEHSLQSLARHFAVNEFKLKKVFKAVHGVTVFDYVFHEKMNYAKHLMLDKHMFVNEAAKVVGYKNANHFSTAFKRKFGVSPKLIRM